jgi:ribose transport system substrate-binding protein
MTVRAWLATVLILGSAALAGGCGGGGSSRPTGGGAGAGGPGRCDLAHVQAKINTYKRIPRWTPPGAAFDAGKAAGNRVFSVQENSANPFTENIVAGARRVAARAGIPFSDYGNQGGHTQWAQGVSAAMTQNADGLLLSGGTIGPIYFRSQAAAARRAGVKIVTIADRDVTQSAEPLVDARVGQPYAEAARLDADWIIMRTKCKADVLVITSNEVIAGDINSRAAEDEFAKYCGGGCKLRFQDVPVTDWSTKIQPIVQSSIAADPNLNYVLPLYDAMSEFVVAGIQVAGMTGRIHIATFNGTPSALRMIQTGSTVEMDVGEDEAQVGYAGMDQMLRLFAGVRPIASGNEHIPLRVFDATNVNEAGVPPQFGVGYGSAWRAGYLKLWGLAG